MREVVDTLHRPLRHLRISVTDRCDLRCTYCMPLEQYEWIPREEILTFEEIARVTRVFVRLGVTKIRLTGGEPLLRRELPELIRQLRELPGLEELCLTTNGTQLAAQALLLRAAGLDRLNVSLDTLIPERFRRIAGRGALEDVLRGIEAARAAGFASLKINTVVERGVNEDEVVPIARFCREHGFGLRFIEIMDVGNVNAWDLRKVVPAEEILRTLRESFQLAPAPRRDPADTALRFVFADGGEDLGIIASVTQPFCGDCTRARITADGKLVTCLFSQVGVDLRGPLRGGATDEELLRRVEEVWRRRTDRFSEDRLSAILSDRGYDPADRKKIEMITLGG